MSNGKNTSKTLGASQKVEVIKKFQINEKDCGSPEVQVALLTQRLEILAKHFEKHTQDRHSRRGLDRIVSKRKVLLSYLKSESPERYKNTISALGLRK